jgi:hypothetical protein
MTIYRPRTFLTLALADEGRLQARRSAVESKSGNEYVNTGAIVAQALWDGTIATHVEVAVQLDTPTAALIGDGP